MKMKIAFLVAVQRGKKRDALDVVPMEVRKENVRADGAAVGLLHQLLSQIAKTGAAVENEDASVQAHFDAGGIASIAQIFGLGRGRRTAYTPESDQHLRSPMPASPVCAETGDTFFLSCVPNGTIGERFLNFGGRC